MNIIIIKMLKDFNNTQLISKQPNLFCDKIVVFRSLLSSHKAFDHLFTRSRIFVDLRAVGVKSNIWADILNKCEL